VARNIKTFTEVTKGVYFVEGPLSNWVVLVAGTEVTLVDAGYPADLPLVEQSIVRAGAVPENLRRIFVTHGHSDHVGSIAALVRLHSPQVFAHPDEIANVRREEVHQVGVRDLLPHLWKPRTLAWTLRAVGAGGLGDVAVPAVLPLETDVALPVAGHRVIAVPTSGHTPGHVAYWLPDSGIVVSGDALVTAHPTSSHSGPQLLMGMFHSNPPGAVAALDILGALDDVKVVLPGHGPLLRTGIRDAADTALHLSKQ
jgi:glyoxylase-like metal-dependent hydrolase (beta-lactamase superfamily II)